ncbi:related to 7alpha-cephem-methoxylase P8 chain [Ramularia collo-cygni]|uniref:Related to 7alpha-cephem-methoxylase P8 chain n=1 Tax=Ramularia collo-cygni TaxID=112498 RepID=A0A2D3V0X5_9PEZI|nr:related to 7alpha-cephem-methoxylase P8 chain [Ramularia collo-cygni]CZT20365.1 related to 7alpha-cephem-methoxylase P8 chain [Ramularia collo-cygni]
MPLATVKYVDPTPHTDNKGNQTNHWSKVEGPFQSFNLLDRTRNIQDISQTKSHFEIDTCGFAVHHWPIQQEVFANNEETIKATYYPQVEELLHEKLPGKIHKIVIFDHTFRQMDKDSPRKPVMQVHVDQTAEAAKARVQRHLPPDEAEILLQSRYSLINVWRPVGNPVWEYPLAVLDWRSLAPEDFVLCGSSLSDS